MEPKLAKIPKRFTNTKYRKEMWENTLAIYKKLAKVLPIKEAYVLGSFTTKKSRPADVDFILLLKTSNKKKARWSVDLVLAPDNDYGQLILQDADNWVKEKYGLNNSSTIRIK